MVGLLPEVTRHCGAIFQREGDRIGLLGDTRGSLGGSEYLHVLHGLTAGLPPRLDAARELALQRLVRQLIRAGLLSSAHDCGDGGLVVALAESCIASRDRLVGATVALQIGSIPPHAYLFGEDPSRAIISFRTAAQREIEQMCLEAGVPFAPIGEVGGNQLAIEGVLRVSTEVLSKAWRSGIVGVMNRST